jgi:hypothetical protein
MVRKFVLGVFLVAFGGYGQAGCCKTCGMELAPTTATAPPASAPTSQVACVINMGNSASTTLKGGPLGHSVTSNRPGCSWTITVTAGGSYNRLTNGSQPNTTASLSAAIPGNTLSGVTGADSKSEYWSFVDASSVDRTAQQGLTAPAGTTVITTVKTINQTNK